MSRFERPTIGPHGERLYGRMGDHTPATIPHAIQRNVPEPPREREATPVVGSIENRTENGQKPDFEGFLSKRDTRERIAGLGCVGVNRPRLPRQGWIHFTSPERRTALVVPQTVRSRKMSFATQAQTTESADSTANNDENDDFAPHPVTSRYLSLQAHHRAVKDAIGAVEDFTMSDTDLPAVKWANAIEAALYGDDGCLGEKQGEMTDYTTDDYKEQHGDSITSEHADLTKDERTELKELFKSSENHSVEDAKGQFKLPVVNGDRLPLLVADEDVLSDGKAMLEDILAEFDNDAGSTPSDVESDAEFPVLEGTLDDLDAHLASEAPDEDTLREMLEAEKDGKDRKGGRSRLNAAIDAHDEESEEEESEANEDDEDDDDTASSTSGGMSDEEKEELATTVATAVVEALDN